MKSVDVYTGRDLCQLTAKTKASQRQILCHHQGIFIKEGDLGTAKTYIYNRRTFLYDLIKLTCFGCNCFITDKALLGVADNVYLQSGTHPYLVQDDAAVFCFTHGSGSIGTVILYPVQLHCFRKFFQDPAQFICQTITYLSFTESIAS